MQGRLSLRERLVILLVAAVLPMFALSIWLAAREAHERIGLTQTQLLFAASLLAANQDRSVDAAEQLLGAVAGMPDLLPAGRDRARCQTYFENLRQRYPMYSNMGLLGVDGQVVCHARGAIGDAGAADRDYFRAALAQRRFVMGEAIVGRLTGRRAIPFALPVVEAGQVTGVVFATLDLEHAAAELARAQVPEAARVLVADRHGRVLMEHPKRPGREVPRLLKHPELEEAARTRRSGAGEGVDGGGEQRVYAFAPGGLVGDEGFIVRVGMTREAALAGGYRQLYEALALLALALLATLAAAWWVGGRVIVMPAKQILGVVRRLEQGNLDARVPLQSGSPRGEFARIGAAFNLMADSLQLRQHDLETELGRSRSAYLALDLVINSMQEALIAVTGTGHFLMFNQAAARLFPLEGPAPMPRQWPALFGFYHPDGVTPYELDELPLVRSARGESGRQALLFVRNSQVPEGRMLQCSWQPIQGESGISGGLVVFTDVTELERLQAEQAAQFAQLQETQRKLIEAQRIGRVGNWELDLRSGRLWWSEEVFGLFGVARPGFEPSLESFEQRVHPDDRAMLKPARDSALRDGKGISLEYRIVRPDGSIAWMHEIGEARLGEQGEPVWFGGVVQDVTERKRVEQALLASERELQDYTHMLQKAAEAAQLIMAHPSLEATLQEVADQARHVIGARQALVTLAANGHTASPARSSSGDADAASPVGGLLTVPLVSRSGRHIGRLQISGKEAGGFTERDEYVLLELAQLASIAIENARLFTEIRELNAGLEARIAERTAELGRQEQLYRTLAQQAPEVVWNTDATGSRLTFLNRAWYELVGGTPEDWLGHSGLAAIHPDDRDAVAANWRRCCRTLETFTGVRRVLARDGSYHTMSYKGAPVLDENGHVAFWVGIDADITEFKAIELALRNSNQELEAFSYSVSHDLRAPLGAIGGFSKALMLKLEGEPDERVRHYLVRIQAGVEKMEQLIEALLSLAKVARAPLTYGPVDLTAIARETLEGLRMQHPDRRVEAPVQEGLVAQGDARLLRVMIENLLGNAWKFTSRRSHARIEVGREPDGHVFFVRDNGVGFDMDYAGKLFGAFQRLHTEAEFPGTGIGLATVRRIVARHQGRVWAESRLGEGTTFFFSLSEIAPPAWLAGQDPA